MNRSSMGHLVSVVAVAVKSMLDHFPKHRELEIIVGDIGISQENKNKLNELWPIKFVKVNIDRVKDIKINIVYHTSAIFARLLMPEILKDIDKALYLDCDIIVKDDITKLSPVVVQPAVVPVSKPPFVKRAYAGEAASINAAIKLKNMTFFILSGSLTA